VKYFLHIKKAAISGGSQIIKVGKLATMKTQRKRRNLKRYYLTGLL